MGAGCQKQPCDQRDGTFSPSRTFSLRRGARDWANPQWPMGNANGKPGKACFLIWLQETQLIAVDRFIGHIWKKGQRGHAHQAHLLPQPFSKKFSSQGFQKSSIRDFNFFSSQGIGLLVLLRTMIRYFPDSWRQFLRHNCVCILSQTEARIINLPERTLCVSCNRSQAPLGKAALYITPKTQYSR